MEKIHILLIEDDIQLNTTISNFLRSINYEVTSLFDGVKAIEKIDNSTFDLHITDINIPKINGLDIIKYIRDKDIDSPIIIITASSELENFKIAFKNGCSEYIKKPFFLEELEIRINNLFKKKNKQINITNNIYYNLKYQELTIDNKKVPLRKKESRLLNILIQHKNHTVATDIIETYVWENNIKENYPLRQLVNEVRKKLDLKQQIIITDIGFGYRLESN